MIREKDKPRSKNGYRFWYVILFSEYRYNMRAGFVVCPHAIRINFYWISMRIVVVTYECRKIVFTLLRFNVPANTDENTFNPRAEYD